MWETGKRTPDTETLKRIANYFNVSLDYLLDNEKNSSFKEDELQEDENLIILNRNAKNLTPEQRKRLLDMAKILFKEDWDD